MECHAAPSHRSYSGDSNVPPATHTSFEAEPCTALSGGNAALSRVHARPFQWSTTPDLPSSDVPTANASVALEAHTAFSFVFAGTSTATFFHSAPASASSVASSPTAHAV